MVLCLVHGGERACLALVSLVWCKMCCVLPDMQGMHAGSLATAAAQWRGAICHATPSLLQRSYAADSISSHEQGEGASAADLLPLAVAIVCETPPLSMSDHNERSISAMLRQVGGADAVIKQAHIKHVVLVCLWQCILPYISCHAARIMLQTQCTFCRSSLALWRLPGARSL